MIDEEVTNYRNSSNNSKYLPMRLPKEFDHPRTHVFFILTW